MAGDEDENTFVQYGINDKPPLGKSLFLGVQHYLTMVGANIAVPLLLAGAMGMPDAVVPRFVGTFFVVSGIATLAQTTFGNRYPIVQGAPFSMLAPALAVIGVVTANPPEGIVAWRAALLQLKARSSSPRSPRSRSAISDSSDGCGDISHRSLSRRSSYSSACHCSTRPISRQPIRTGGSSV